jgi:hypothetical protein
MILAHGISQFRVRSETTMSSGCLKQGSRSPMMRAEIPGSSQPLHHLADQGLSGFTPSSTSA